MIKQTQTKLFDFSDVGLNFSAGSKNLFPDRFKKMLSTGYNPQTASSVNIVDNQVTLIYDVLHGYVADRVLQVTAVGYDKEVYIDSVTSSTVTFTDTTISGIVGNVNTKVASLGWELVYELANIQVYKFKALDESDLYLRLCFQDVTSSRNCIAPCVGKSYDPATGFITDTNALTANKDKLSPVTGIKFDFNLYVNSYANSYNYASGFSEYGMGKIVGSAYHLVIATNTEAGRPRVNAILPLASFDYDTTKLPLILAEDGGNASQTTYNYDQNDSGRAFIGNIECMFDRRNYAVVKLFTQLPTAISSFLPATIDSFNTTTAKPLEVFEKTTGQFLGFGFGLYQALYAQYNIPNIERSVSPSLVMDADLQSYCVLHAIGTPSSANTTYLVAPIEEIKIVS